MGDSDQGATYLRYQQVSGGRDVYGGTGLVTVDAKGRVLLAAGSFVSQTGAAPKADLTAAEAVAVVAGDVAPNQDSEPGRRLGAKDGTVEFENTLAVPDYDGAPVVAELVTVGTAEGARSAWQVQADRASNASYVVLVDAVTGEVLVRQNQLSEDNQGTVFQGEDPEAGGTQPDRLPRGLGHRGRHHVRQQRQRLPGRRGRQQRPGRRPAARRRPALELHLERPVGSQRRRRRGRPAADRRRPRRGRDAALLLHELVPRLRLRPRLHRDRAQLPERQLRQRRHRRRRRGGGVGRQLHGHAVHGRRQQPDQVPQQRQLQRQRRRRDQAADADVRRRHRPRQPGAAYAAGQQPRHDHPRVHPRDQRPDHLRRQPGRRHPVQLAGRGLERRVRDVDQRRPGLRRVQQRRLHQRDPRRRLRRRLARVRRLRRHQRARQRPHLGDEHVGGPGRPDRQVRLRDGQGQARAADDAGPEEHA